MKAAEKKTSRKRFLLWGSTLLASVTALKFLKASKPEKSETVKMLTQDGTLVEIDKALLTSSAKALLTSSAKKITNEELQHWIKK
jgi:hypothetical protein